MQNRNRIRATFAAAIVIVVAVVSMAGKNTRNAAAQGSAKGATGAKQVSASEPTCYMSVFAYETTPRAPQTAHTFATFIKHDGAALSAHTISWFPQSNAIRLLKPPEPGVNLTMERTIENANAVHAQVHEWGPYRIKPELYERALRQIARLESGRVQFKVLDRRQRPDFASCCIHAVSDVTADQGMLMTGPAYGVEASAMVVDYLEPWILQRSRRYPDISLKAGLPKGTIIHE
jgi:hypothetical protein